MDADSRYASAGEKNFSSDVAEAEGAGMSTGGSNQPAGDVLERVRQALGRRERLKSAPIPPELPEDIVRLVRSEIRLAELFARRAEENKMHVAGVSAEELGAKLAEYLR